MENHINQLKEKVINFLSKHKNLDQPYISNGRKEYSRNDIINEIKNDTDDGIKFVNDLIMLALDLFDRNKEEIKNHKKV